MSATETTTTRRGPGRPKGTTSNSDTAESSDLLRCFVVESKTATGSRHLAVRPSLARAIAVAIENKDETGDDDQPKFSSVRVYQMRSSNIAFDAFAEDD